MSKEHGTTLACHQTTSHSQLSWTVSRVTWTCWDCSWQPPNRDCQTSHPKKMKSLESLCVSWDVTANGNDGHNVPGLRAGTTGPLRPLSRTNPYMGTTACRAWNCVIDNESVTVMWDLPLTWQVVMWITKVEMTQFHRVRVSEKETPVLIPGLYSFEQHGLCYQSDKGDVNGQLTNWWFRVK